MNQTFSGKDTNSPGKSRLHNVRALWIQFNNCVARPAPCRVGGGKRVGKWGGEELGGWRGSWSIWQRCPLGGRWRQRFKAGKLDQPRHDTRVPLCGRTWARVRVHVCEFVGEWEGVCEGTMHVCVCMDRSVRLCACECENVCRECVCVCVSVGVCDFVHVCEVAWVCVCVCAHLV